MVFNLKRIDIPRFYCTLLVIVSHFISDKDVNINWNEAEYCFDLYPNNLDFQRFICATFAFKSISL